MLLKSSKIRLFQVSSLLYYQFAPAEYLPGRVGYQQQEAPLWSGLHALMRMLGPAPLREAFARQPTLRLVILRHCADLFHADYDRAITFRALDCATNGLVKLRRHFWDAAPGNEDPGGGVDPAALQRQLLDALHLSSPELGKLHYLLTQCVRALFVSILDLAAARGAHNGSCHNPLPSLRETKSHPNK